MVQNFFEIQAEAALRLQRFSQILIEAQDVWIKAFWNSPQTLAEIQRDWWRNYLRSLRQAGMPVHAFTRGVQSAQGSEDGNHVVYRTNFGH